jgi:hypothetical protein
LFSSSSSLPPSQASCHCSLPFLLPLIPTPGAIWQKMKWT